MNETYTFSRALHMMRYGGKRMKPEKSKSGVYLYVDTSFTHGQLRIVDEDGDTSVLSLDAVVIMGSWVEVDDV